jgi:hypothetical protein
MFAILVAANRRETLLNQSGHPFHTSPEAKFIQGPPPTHNPKFIHLEHGKYVYRNVYNSSLYVVERPSDALYISLKSLNDLRLKNQGSTNFSNT